MGYMTKDEVQRNFAVALANLYKCVENQRGDVLNRYLALRSAVNAYLGAMALFEQSYSESEMGAVNSFLEMDIDKMKETAQKEMDK